MYYFIVNTHARRGNAAYIWEETQVALEKAKVPYKAFESAYEGHATEIAKELTESITEPINLVILGGDGTINEVVNGIVNFDMVKFGVIPTGSGNDFAGGLGINGSVEDTIGDILSHKAGTKLDIGHVAWNDNQNERLFCVSSGIGFDALVCKKSITSRLKNVLNAIRLGNLTYGVLAVQSLLMMKTFGLKLTLSDNQEKEYEKVIFLAAMNLRAEGGGIQMAPKAKANDGLVSFCVAAGIPVWIRVPYFILLLMAKHEKLKHFDILNNVSCHIHTDAPVELHADGEYLADVTDVWYECLPGKLELLNTIKDK